MKLISVAASDGMCPMYHFLEYTSCAHQFFDRNFEQTDLLRCPSHCACMPFAQTRASGPRISAVMHVAINLHEVGRKHRCLKPESQYSRIKVFCSIQTKFSVLSARELICSLAFSAPMPP